MANPFSTYGLMMQGVDTSRGVQQQYNMNEQNAAQSAKKLQLLEQEAAQQRALQQQKIEEGSMGLEDLRRNRTADAATRATASSAAAAGRTLSGSLLDMADTEAKSGRIDKALAYRDAYKQLEDMGAKTVVHTALTDPSTGERPDLVQILNQNERTKGVTAASLDDDGILTVTRGTGQAKINIGMTAERLGLVKAPDLKTIPAGGVGVLTQPGKPVQTITAPKTFREAPKDDYVVKTAKDADGNETQQIIDVRPGSPTYGKEVAPGEAKSQGATNVRKDLPVLNDITKGISDLGEEYGKTDMSNPLNPKITLTEKGRRTAMVAEQVRLANQSLAPRTIIDIAVNGKPMWKTENGKRSGVVIYNGQEFEISTPSAKSVAARAPSAVAPPAPVEASAPAPAVQAKTKKPAAQAPSGRDFDAALEKSDPELFRMGSILRLGLKNPDLDFKLWTSYVTRAKQLGSRKYAKGGKF